MATKKKPAPVVVTTRDGAQMKVEARTVEQSAVVHVGVMQYRLDPVAARQFARELRRVAGVIDPDPTE